MFIMTRKRLEEEKAKAVREHEERMWLDERLNRMENNFYREIKDLHKKVDALKNATNKQECEDFDYACGFCPPPVNPREVAIHE